MDEEKIKVKQAEEQQLSEIVKKSKKASRLIGLLSSIAALIGFAALIIPIYNSTLNQKSINSAQIEREYAIINESKSDNITNYVKSIKPNSNSKEFILDSISYLDLVKKLDNMQISNSIKINHLGLKENNVKKFILELLSDIKSDSTIGKYYADTIQDYYSRKDVLLEQIKKDINSINQVHPGLKITFNNSDITVNLKEDNTSEVYVNAKCYSDSTLTSTETIFQIKLNQSMKVYFIRNLVPSIN